MSSLFTENNSAGNPRKLSDAIAIIGMACIFPGAGDLATYWQNILGKVDAVTDPPEGAWDPAEFYQDESLADFADQVYCRKGGYLAPLADFNPLEYGIMPVGLDGGEPDQWLALKVAYDALKDANYVERLRENPLERQRAAVILGKGTYLNRGNLNMVQHSLVLDQTLHILHELHPELSEEMLQGIRSDLKQQLPPFNVESAPGLVPNITAGRIANRLDLMGPAYTVDAACASSLIAVEHAVHELNSGRSDLVLVGGVHVSTPAPILSLFSQLGALSHQEEIRPFDARADGTILSEGIGVVVLKRAADAIRDGERIYAMIKGVGSSSDGRGMSVLTPRLEGEVLALQRAFAMAEVEPDTVGLIEAHGTGTAVGDRTEIEALRNIFKDRESQLPHCALGTVKSMIGHTMPAAGIAGLIKVALSLHHKVLPPTIHVDEPDPRLELDKSAFYLNTEVRPWIHPHSETPRRAGVNAFGFGGVNAHVLLEEVPEVSPAAQAALPNIRHIAKWESEVVIVGAASRTELVANAHNVLAYCAANESVDLSNLAYTLTTEAVNAQSTTRIAIVAESVSDLCQKVEHAIARIEKPNTRQIKDLRGIYFFEESFYEDGDDMDTPRLAFLFPGEGAQYAHMMADLCIHFPEVRACFDQIDELFAGHPRGFRPSDFIFPRAQLAEKNSQISTQLWQIDGAVEAVLTANLAMWILLQKLGIQADAVVGHSTGEYSALLTSGAIAVNSDEFVTSYLMELNRRYNEVLHKTNVPHAVMVAMGTGLPELEELIDKVYVDLFAAGGSAPAVHISMDNCPHQTVVLGEAEIMDRVMASAKAKGIICEVLPFERGYHSPLFEPYSSLFEELFNTLPIAPPKTPVYSCITAARFEDDVEKIRSLATANWVNRVRFRETIQKMFDDGIRIFVEVGPRGNLSSFTGDILRGHPHLAIASNLQHRSGLSQLNHLLAILGAQKVDFDLGYYYQRRGLQLISLEVEQPIANRTSTAHTFRLATGWAGLKLSPSISQMVQRHLRKKEERFEALVKETLQSGLKSRDEKEPPLSLNESGHTSTNGHAHGQNEHSEWVELSTLDNWNNTTMNQLTSYQHNGADGDLGDVSPVPMTMAAGPSNIQSNGHYLPQTTSLQAVDETTLVMQSHFELMQKFLQTQEAIMMHFLAMGGATAREVVVPAIAPTYTGPAVVARPAMPAQNHHSTLPGFVPASQPVEAIATPMQAPTAPQNGGGIASPAPAVAVAAPATLDLKETLLRLVSERTGYPQEMLDLSANLEADLGIDSIKRVEIISAFNRETKLLAAKDIEHVSTLTSLGAMLDFFYKSSS